MRMKILLLVFVMAYGLFAGNPRANDVALPPAHALVHPSSQDMAAVGRAKNPALGVLMSVAVPGAGEFYAGKWIKGTLLLALETTLWLRYFNLKDEGDKMRTEFRAYADAHWSEARWNHSEGSHSLPETKTQQYYEMIGKYDQFASGWDDFNGEVLTPRRDHYETMRDKHNQKLINAGYCNMGMLANRVLSAFDTAFTIRSINRRVQGGVRMGLVQGAAQKAPGMKLAFQW